MPIEREKMAARLYPEVAPSEGTRLLERIRAALCRLARFLRMLVLRTLYLPIRRRLFKINRWTRKRWRSLAILLVLFMVWGSVHVYWYNKLVMLEYDVLTAWAQIEVEQQRRYHIQKNAVELIIGYADHERSLMLDVTELRARDERGAAAKPAKKTRAPSPDDPPAALTLPAVEELTPEELNAVFPRIMMIGEQYPNLRLTENFQQVTEAVIATETRIAERIAKYNDVVNMYTTALRQFPGSVFASIWGFEERDYYRPEAGAIEFHPMDYQGRRRAAAAVEAP